MRWRFALKFLTAFAIIVPLWWATAFGDLYRSAVLGAAQAMSPLLSGWWLETPARGTPAFTHAGETLPLYLNLGAIAMGLMPLLSLIIATPGQSPQRIAACLPIAMVLYLAIDVLVVLIYPLVMHEPNMVKDTIGVFSGLIAFVVAPLGVWFVLTYPALRTVWQLDTLE